MLEPRRPLAKDCLALVGNDLARGAAIDRHLAVLPREPNPAEMLLEAAVGSPGRDRTAGSLEARGCEGSRPGSGMDPHAVRQRDAALPGRQYLGRRATVPAQA